MCELSSHSRWAEYWRTDRHSHGLVVDISRLTGITSHLHHDANCGYANATPPRASSDIFGSSRFDRLSNEWSYWLMSRPVNWRPNHFNLVHVLPETMFFKSILETHCSSAQNVRKSTTVYLKTFVLLDGSSFVFGEILDNHNKRYVKY